MTKKNVLHAAVAILVVLLLLGIAGRYWVYKYGAEEYRTFESPDRRYKVVVYRVPQLIGMPGGSGDASGYVRLYDSSGRVLAESNVDMVQNVDKVYWEDGKVDVKFVAEWQLP